MYKIEEPIYFYLLAIIPAMLVLFLLVLWWKKRTQCKFSDVSLLKKLAPNSSTFKSTLKLVILLLGIAFLIISLTNPKMGTKLKTIKREGVDVVFALDVSKSMLAEDIAPNRLEKAKQIISKTINTLNETGSMEAVCFLTEQHVKGRDTYWKVRQAVETTQDCLYTFNQLKSKKVGNLYFTGQLTVPGPGVPPALISGKLVSDLINKQFLEQ